MVSIVFLHGVGGADAPAVWLDPLNARLRALGYPFLDGKTVDKIIVPEYLVRPGDEVEEPPVTYKPDKEDTRLGQALDFTARQKELEAFVRRHADGSGPGLGYVPGGIVDPAASVAEWLRFPDVSAYMGQKGARSSVWRQVLDQLPAEGRVIIVAHSLGSVVMADLLRRLPSGVTVDLLVTIGSPLAFGRYRSNSGLTGSGFPYGRVQRWLNVAAPLDGVCGGRGISSALPQVVDVHTDLSFSHRAAAYMSHPAVAAAVGFVAFTGEPRSTSDAPPAAPALRIHESWNTVLLGTAFSLQVANGLPTGRWEEKRRLDFGRQEAARRICADIAVRRKVRSEQLAELKGMGVELDPGQLADHPLADGRFPDHDSLTYGAAAQLAGNWRDQELLALAVGLMLAPVVSPFDVKVSKEARQEALQATLNIIRRSRGNISDGAYASQVGKSIEWTKDQVVGSRFPLAPVLIGSGVLLLAATGVGLAMAAPVGLAGAAVVTSTLAGFGPGGMIGGLITLGVLTGTTASVATVGVKEAFESDATSEAEAAARSAEDLVAASADSLTATLTGMLAVVHAQLGMGFDSSEPLVRMTLLNALDIARAEHLVHAQVAPDGRTMKDWALKVERLERAIDALDSLGTTGISRSRKSIESGKLSTPNA